MNEHIFSEFTYSNAHIYGSVPEIISPSDKMFLKFFSQPETISRRPISFVFNIQRGITILTYFINVIKIKRQTTKE